MNSGIYIIQNKKDKKRYIGSAINFDNRFYLHKYELRNNKHNNKHLQNAWNKFGEELFEFIIVEYAERNQLIEREQYWLDMYTKEEKYNILTKAYSTLDYKFSNEQKHILSDLKIGEKSPWYGKQRTEETCKKISESQKGEKHHLFGKHRSEATKRKMSESMKGEKNPNFGKPRSKEVCLKISKTKRDTKLKY